MKHTTNLAIGLLLGFSGQSHAGYESSYENIAWSPRGNDAQYCLDITDENGNVYPGYQAFVCVDKMYNFSPKEYINNIFGGDLQDGFTFHWKIWSQSGYGDSGYEGKVVVGSQCKASPYSSSSSNIQWGCYNQDTYYCVDILDDAGNILNQAVECGENLHNFNPSSLSLAQGEYKWRTWSPSVNDYSSYHNGFEGEFHVGTEDHDSFLENDDDDRYENDDDDDDDRYENENINNDTSPVTIPPESTANGKSIYVQYCASCHGDLVLNGYHIFPGAANVAKTRNAINANSGGMGYLSFLTDADLNAIADYIRNAK
jgi:hypothetical protein